VLRLKPEQRAEIADELRDHLEARLEELSASGLPRDQAVRQALDELGDAAHLADHFTRISQLRKRRLIMRCTIGTLSAATAAVMGAVLFWPAPPPGPHAFPGMVVHAQQEIPPPATSKLLERNRATQAKLDETMVKPEFVETPLDDVLVFLG